MSILFMYFTKLIPYKPAELEKYVIIYYSLFSLTAIVLQMAFRNIIVDIFVCVIFFYSNIYLSERIRKQNGWRLPILYLLELSKP
jgi:hypothetical protein